MADKVKIDISGDASGAEATIKDLEKAYFKAFDKMAGKAEGTSEEISRTFHASGIRTEKAIKESSAKARQNYEKIKNSGVASANDIKRAHNVMTAKIKRNTKELSTGAGLLSKAFSAFKGNLVAIGASAVALGFTLKKAFDFGESAARLKTQRDAFNNFTASVGGSSDKLIEKLQEVSRGTVATSDLVASAGKALLLGLDPSKITELLEVARASSKITGESLTKQFEDIAKGTGRASRLILDNLGIMFSQAEASRRAADAAGVLVSELTLEQIAVGNLNEVIRQGQPIIRGVGKDFLSQADVLAIIRARYANLVVLIGQKFLKILPKVEIAVLKLSKKFLQWQKIQFQVISSWTKILKVFGVAEFVTNRAENSTALLTKGIEFLDKSIDSATKTFEELNAAEKRGIAQADTLRENAETRKRQLEREAKLISKKKRIEEEAIQTVTELTTAQNELLKQSISATKQELRELEAEIQRSRSFAQQVLDEIAASDIRVAQAGFDPVERLLDNLKRAEDGLDQAAQERAAGNVEKARKLTLAAIQASNAIIELQEGAAKDSEASTRELNKAKFQAERIRDAAKDFAFEMRTANEEALPGVQEALGSMAAQLELGEETLKGVKDGIIDATQAAELLKIKLSEPTTATHTQIINTVNTGGGGETQGFRVGGRLPGYGGGDRVNILAEAGEYIMRKESVKKMGEAAAQAFNRGDVAGVINSLPAPQKFQEGGQVQSETRGTTNVNLSLGGKNFPMVSQQSVADSFVKEIKSINVVRGRKRTPY